MAYVPPIDDIRFALESAANFWSVTGDGAFPDLDADLFAAILEGAAAFARDTIAPTNRDGDQTGVSLVDGAVTTPQSFKNAYRAFVEGGWQGLAASASHGGQGLPRSLALAVHEMIHSANMAFGLAPMLTLGAIEALEAHGAPEQQALYLQKLISGEWTGTMNLTEPQAGSDVGALTTRAEPLGDGRYALTGQKIYITWGEHDLTDNIVHLVLARLPDAPGGSKGISLFLAPKFMPDGTRNALRCIGLEEKLGIHASPTCTMAYDGAIAWLVGQENRGLAAMFTMMNAARINVGVEGVAVGEAAYQKALDYARDRRQGRAEGASEPGASAILAHADVRRMLLTARARTLAGRAICYATGVASDRATHAASEAEREAAKAREDLLTPIAKSWCTDGGVEAASLGIQVHGGMGFVEEGGAAQFYRDARIAPIYEGTNGIQAIDLYGRKLTADAGAAMRTLIEEARTAADQAAPAIGAPLAAATETLARATDWMLAAPRIDALAGASAYLDLAGRVVGGMLLAQGVARAPSATEQAAVARFYAATVLSAAPGLLGAVMAGADALYDPAIAAFA